MTKCVVRRNVEKYCEEKGISESCEEETIGFVKMRIWGFITNLELEYGENPECVHEQVKIFGKCHL